MESSVSGFLASSLAIRSEYYERASFPTTANNGGSPRDGFEGTSGALRSVQLQGRCNRLVTCG